MCKIKIKDDSERDRDRDRDSISNSTLVARGRKFDYDYNACNGLSPLLCCSWLAVKDGYARIDPVTGFIYYKNND